MIRTHRPRGHAWTCPSAFQQTELFRQIKYEDCVVDGDDPEENDFTASERAAKRRRIETLADTFLNGQSLYISSARLGPQSLAHAVCLSFRRPKDGRAVIAEARDSIEARGANWEDVQDEWEVLQDFNQQREEHIISDENTKLEDSLALSDGDAHGRIRSTVVRAQASCSSARKARVVRLAVGPSEEALRQAAELRNRIASRKSARQSAHTSIPQESLQNAVGETQDDTTDTSILSSVSDIGPTPTAAWTSSKWIKSGLLELRRKAVDEECSKDELGLSSLATPSQRKEARTRANLRRARDGASQADTIVSSAVNQSTGLNLQMSAPEESFSGAISGTNPSAGVVSETVPEDTHSALVSTVQADDQANDGDSQDQLLHRQGLHVAPRRSWAPVNSGSSTGQKGTILDSAESPPKMLTISPDLRQSILESSQQNAGKLKAKRSTKSTGTAMYPPPRRSTRRQSAPTQSQALGIEVSNTGNVQVVVDRPERADYTAAPSRDSSPFLFRKRTSKSITSGITDAGTKKTTRSRKINLDDQNSEDLPVINDDNLAVDVPLTKKDSVKTPRRSVDFSSTNQASRSAAASKTPLTDLHLNQILPTDPKRRTSIRKSLRQELLKNGAEISLLNDDLTLDTSPTTATEQSQPQLWPGTQVLLAKAQTDLFTSPEKPQPAESAADPTTTTTPYATADQASRAPLRTLSQERTNVPLPSTQALIDNWQGWSSVKKPRRKSDDLKRKSLIPSPTVQKRIGSSDEERRSSLRFELDLSLNEAEGEEEDSQAPAHGDGVAASMETTIIRQLPSFAGVANNLVSSVPKSRSPDDRDATTFSANSATELRPNRRPRPFAPHRPLVPLSSDHGLQVSSTLSLHGGLSSLQLPLPTGSCISMNASNASSAENTSVLNDIVSTETGTEYLRLSFQQAQVFEGDSSGFDGTTEMVSDSLQQHTVSGEESQTEGDLSSRKRQVDGTSQLSQDLEELVQDVLVKSTEGYLGAGSF